MHAAHFILYVANQAASTAFYREALALAPRLDVPGMTEFVLGNGAILGLMPEAGAKRLLAPIAESIGHTQSPRAELYLVVDDAEAAHQLALRAGARELSPVAPRDWGHDAGYALDPDGHVLAFASEQRVRGVSLATHSDDAAIHALNAAWAKGLEERDLDAIMTPYARDVIFFDVKPPLRTVGSSALRAIWEACLPYFSSAIITEFSDVDVVVSGDRAMCHCLFRFGLAEVFRTTNAAEHPPWVRITRSYHRLDASWCITHEHCSMPFDPMTGRVVFITDARA